MSVAKVTEIISLSSKSFDDAVENGIKEHLKHSKALRVHGLPTKKSPFKMVKFKNTVLFLR